MNTSWSFDQLRWNCGWALLIRPLYFLWYWLRFVSCWLSYRCFPLSSSVLLFILSLSSTEKLSNESTDKEVVIRETVVGIDVLDVDLFIPNSVVGWWSSLSRTIVVHPQTDLFACEAILLPILKKMMKEVWITIRCETFSILIDLFFVSQMIKINCNYDSVIPPSPNSMATIAKNISGRSKQTQLPVFVLDSYIQGYICTWLLKMSLYSTASEIFPSLRSWGMDQICENLII